MSYDCYCDYGEQPRYYTAAVRSARKVHQCEECGKAIQVGERYENVSANWEGIASRFKTCPRCLALREHLKAHARCFCWMHGSLLDDVRDTVRDMPEEAYGSGLLFELGRLAVAIRRAPSLSAIRRGES